MPDSRRRMPAWLLWTITLACAGWCVALVAGVFLPVRMGGIEPVRVLASFTHDRTAGPIPWRATLIDREAQGWGIPDGVWAGVVSRRRSNLGFPWPIFKPRRVLMIRGEAPYGMPHGVPLPSVEDAESLLQTEFARLPADADRDMLALRTEFLRTLAPRSVEDELDHGAIVVDASLLVAATGAALSAYALHRRGAKQAV